MRPISVKDKNVGLFGGTEVEQLGGTEVQCLGQNPVSEFPKRGFAFAIARSH